MKPLRGQSRTEGKGLKRRPFPRPPSQLASRQPSLRSGSPSTILLPFRSLSGTIRKPASLRSDLADRLLKIADRFQRRMSDRFRKNPQLTPQRLHSNAIAQFCGPVTSLPRERLSDMFETLLELLLCEPATAHHHAHELGRVSNIRKRVSI